MNAVEIEEAISALAEKPFDPAGFPFAFLEAFGNKDTTIKRLRSGASNASDMVGGVLQRNNIHVAACAPGAVGATLKALRESPRTISAKAKFILATDGATVEAEDLGSGEVIASEYRDIAQHFGFFLPLAGISTVREIKNNPIDVKATGRLNKLYVELLKDNPDWSAADRRHDMNHFMARLIFCFFAEDTGIFQPTKIFTKTVTQMSDSQAGNTHEVVSTLFRAMNVKGSDRAAANTPRWADVFPYVNGGLFSGSADVPRFSRIARSYLLRVGDLNWREINPDIFGSMIQAVADDEERGALGLHYTSVPNILKVLNPLFLDDLRSQMEAAGDNARALLNLRKRISKIRVFDPACGSGNFLVIAYKQMRAIEAEINRRRGEAGIKTEIPLTNFRGIELRDFPAEIARLALIIAEYQCDVLYRGQQEALAEFLPLDAMNWITCANALRVDWLSICPATGSSVKFAADDLFNAPLDQAQINFGNEGGEIYICGNPPYLGAKKKSKEQTEDMNIAGLSDAQLLDYVGAFIVKGLGMLKAANCRMALVSTSSICQGEQVSLLWPKIYKQAFVKFAYRPFKWTNSAANNAGVFCTIIGLESEDRQPKQLFSEDQIQDCKNISPYLVPGPNVFCIPRDEPISKLALMKMGSNPVDGKNLIVATDDVCKICLDFPEAAKYFKKYGGTKELVSGTHRWCLWVTDNDVENALKIPPIKNIIDQCRSYREGGGRDARKAARRPHAFCYSTFMEREFIHVGKVIGSSFEFIPADLKAAGFVSSDMAFTIYGARMVEFAIVASTLQRVWAETVSGRLGDGTRYGNTIVYNTFPLPELTDKNRSDLTRGAENILLAREANFPATIADLYAADKMPEDLRRAHDENDDVLERIYVGRRFKNDTERLEKLFDLYTRLTAAPPPAIKKVRKAA